MSVLKIILLGGEKPGREVRRPGEAGARGERLRCPHWVAAGAWRSVCWAG